jgi:hypothetical protein
METQTGLNYMRSRTVVDCDTMDEEGVLSFPRPFFVRNIQLMLSSRQVSRSIPGLHLESGKSVYLS